MAQRVHESIEVQAPSQDVFAYWSNFENFPELCGTSRRFASPAGTRAIGG